jgi:hypothetical protein
LLAPVAALAGNAGAAAIQPQSYDEIFWAAKWARWEAACSQKNAISRFSKKYGSRYEALRLRYAGIFPAAKFPDLPEELNDGTVVWSCQYGYHDNQERKFSGILKRQEIALGLRKK